MAFHLSDIRVQQLGPISQLQWQPKQFNLIYGHNEKGKTHLVEFLIRSLFRKSKAWQLRSQTGQGRVLVQREGEILQFSPTSQTKLEDLWESEGKGLPPDLSRLLVVKGAEVELAGVPAGIDKAVLKRFLSNQEVLDEIGSNISPTIQAAQIGEGVVIGPNRGELKNREEIQKLMKRLDELFLQIDKGYSGGKRARLAEKKKQIQLKVEELEKAKAHQAYRLQQQIDGLENQKRLIDLNKLRYIREKLSALNQKQDELQRRKKQQLKAEEDSLHFEWLKQVLEFGKTRITDRPVQIHPWFFIGAGAACLGAMGAFYLKILWGTALGVALAIILLILQILLLRKQVSQKPKADEWEAILSDYRERFGTELKNLADLESQIAEMSESHSLQRVLQKQVEEGEAQLQQLRNTLANKIMSMTREDFIPPDGWMAFVLKQEEAYQTLDDKQRQTEQALARLDVQESGYLEEPQKVDYQSDMYHSLKKELERTELDLVDEENKLNKLKEFITKETGDSSQTDWDVVIEHLRDKRERVVQDYKQCTAEIIGKKMVFDVLDQLRKDEDEKIVRGLQTKGVTEPLLKLTGHYSQFELSDDQLFVSDSIQTFALSELSSGAREQALLALRMGFSARLFKDEPLFLILDDAFQYSDWQRREGLAEKIVELAVSGWQIFYFTMDDHIRDLLQEKGQTLKDQFMYQALG